MPDAAQVLPLTSTVVPEDQLALAEEVRHAFAAKTPIYTIGGATALDFGLPAKTPGIGLSTAALNRVIDYPARDMTITVEAGITMAALAEILAAEGQQLPIDVPFPDRATLGGVIATNWSGPRRYGHGTIRDYVIGISAVDGRGVGFKAGGRVVKNVAGYDFCKLLTGSLGTLAVITQVTLKVKPIPEESAWAVLGLDRMEAAEDLYRLIAKSQSTPVAIELQGGSHFCDLPRIAILVEGTATEVEWMFERLKGELAETQFAGIATHMVAYSACPTYFEAHSEPFVTTVEAPFVVRLNLPPSQRANMLARIPSRFGQISFQAHAGNGIVDLAFHNISRDDIPRLIREELQPLAAKATGSIIVLHCPGVELSRELVWGPPRGDHLVMQAVKNQFDPADILNPGRFVY